MPPTIRLANQDDAQQVLAIYAPYCSTPISFELCPPTLEQMRQRIARVLEAHPWLVCDADGDIWGYAYASRHRERAAYCWSVDSTVYVHPLRHRLGIGRALYASLFAVLALQGYINAYAGIALPNPGSIGLHTAMGFQPVGVYRQVGFKAGAWHDVGWYQLLLQRRPAEPQPPKPLDQVRHTAAWQSALHTGLSCLHSGAG
jgi:phosphinothricin acetyltransferase